MSTTDFEKTQAKFATIVKHLTREDGVSVGAPGQKGFGSTALRVNSKIFAMVTRDGRFVVKLPKPQVATLESAGTGQKFDPGHGRVMQEWLSLRPGSERCWLALSKEALEFVRG